MKLDVIAASALSDHEIPLAYFAFEDAGLLEASALTPGARKDLLASASAEGFKGQQGECVSFSTGKRRHILAGLGKKKGYSTETLRRAAGALVGFSKGRFETVAASVPPAQVQPAAEGLLLASYRFEEYKKGAADKLNTVKLVSPKPADRPRLESAAAKAALYAEAVCLVRDLVNRGPSDKTPQSLAELARSLSGPQVSVSIINRKQAAALGMGAFLGVARGSAVEPAFIHLVYKPKQGKKRIGLVGKGITFDSGGLSLKPAASMETMKLDMAGAASVLGVFKVLARLKVKAEVHGFCAVTYNMPGPDAVKPGDVVRAMNGKTIEVLNTDAEGRLVLADALCYAALQKLDAIIDLATLTGAVVTALGSKVAGAMTNDRALLGRLLSAGAAANEAYCELPLVAEYKEGIKSSIADLQNIGKARGEAGSIIGGLFLQEFVGDTPWVHLDIAGTAWTDADGPYASKGGTGTGVRTLLEYLSAL